jgi:hypothetical protein
MSRARTFADLATASEAGDLGKRNMIINGNMEVAQRSTSVAVTASGYHTCDRWGITLDSAGRFTMSQESITDLEGFGKALKLDCTTADTSIASSEVLFLYQKFEGQFLQRMQKGFSSAKPVTVSFYVKGNASATYVAELLDADNSSRHINKSFSVTTSWSRVSLTFPGDTTGKLDADNAYSLRLNIWLHAGSDYSGGTLQTSWGSSVGANRAAGITSFFDSTDREFFITGVQMELGEVATPFEHETFDDNLVRCQRYYQKSYVYETAPGTATQHGFWSTGGHQGGTSTGYVEGIINFERLMRATPTLTLYDHSGNSNKCARLATGTARYANESISTSNLNARGVTMYSTSGTAAGIVQGHYTVSAEL